MKDFKFIIIVVSAITVLSFSEVGQNSNVALHWYDTSGNLINAHGGGIMFHDGVYYWYGEYKGDSTYLYEEVKHWECWRTDARGVNCYSSTNLTDWKYEGCVLPVSEKNNIDLSPSQIIERPKVIYNETTRQFVMWMHVDSPDYGKAHAGVAVSDSPVGPFQYLGSMKPDGMDSRDQTLFKDDDGKAYQISSSDNNSTICIHLLDSTYTKATGSYIKVFENCYREAPAIFKRKGKYYMLSSGCTGWVPNASAYALSDSMLGNWQLYGNPCFGAGADKSFGAQVTYVLKVNGKDDCYLAMFDQWNKTNLKQSRYIWLPIVFNDNVPSIEWCDDINIDE